jgi:hypothetical protein
LSADTGHVGGKRGENDGGFRVRFANYRATARER